MRTYARKTNSKYNAKKTVVDGILFDSNREARRYRELKAMEAAGRIRDLELQVDFTLIPQQREPDIIGPKGGITKGRVIEHKVSYVADFMYYDTDTQEVVVEDVKGFRTPEYKIKRKLMLERYGIRIREV